MNDATIRNLANEALSSLQGYQKTGIKGLLTKGLDRCRALGLNLQPQHESGEWTQNLIDHLELWY